MLHRSDHVKGANAKKYYDRPLGMCYKDLPCFSTRSLGLWRYENSNMAQDGQNGEHWSKWSTLMIPYLQDHGALEPK